MGYLTRDERREEILQAAMRVALAEGFSAMTVRRIASEAGVATGQVHHHFTSGGELKSLAFIRLIRELVAAQHPCLSVCDQWVEDAVAAEELAGIFLHPHP